jgi:signal transduction histidine kinase
VKLAVAAIALQLLVWAPPATADSPPPEDITASFEVLYAPWDVLTAEDFFQENPPGPFEPLNPPVSISRLGKEAWLRTTLPEQLSDQPMTILEIPGQIFNFIDVWFRYSDGEIEHYYAGDRYPYISRAVKHASTAFPIPKNVNGPIDILIRARNETTHSMNFAAQVWPEQSWQNYLMAKRAWYGVFMGAVLALCLYNLFLAYTLRDSSYLFYVGYVLCLSFSVMLLSGLAEEYLWPEGKPAPMVLATTGIGTFLAVGFVNQFLKIKASRPRLYWMSTLVSALALICGLILVFSRHLPLVPAEYSTRIVHLLMLISAIYFIGTSLVSYFSGVTQARFLALSMFAMLACMLVYFSYTYGFVAYNSVIGHALEFGTLADGILLSLALADRITILTRDKQLAERAAFDAHKNLSKQLIFAREKERQKLSEVLHDSIGHAVLVLKNNLQSHSNSLEKQTSSAMQGHTETLDEEIGQCAEIMSDIRRLSHDLHPHILQRLGLAAAIDATFERALEPVGIKWDLDIETLPSELESELEITVYRVIQEGLTNILKHANATEVECSIHATPENIQCKLSDNGIGFDPTSINGDSLGLQESIARIQLLGGRFKVKSVLGQGTTVQFELPIRLLDNNSSGIQKGSSK